MTDTAIGDYRYISSRYALYGIQTKIFTDVTPDTNSSELIIWREYLNTRPTSVTWTNSGYYKTLMIDKVLGFEFGKSLNSSNKIYNMGEVFAYT